MCRRKPHVHLDEDHAEYDGQQGHTRSVTCVYLGSYVVATGSADADVRLWNPRTGKCQRVLRGHENTVRCLAMNPAQRVLISGAADMTARLWLMPTGKCLRVLRGHEKSVKCVGISHNFFATGGEDGLVIMGHYSESRSQMRKARETALQRALKASAKAKGAASASGDGSAKGSGAGSGKSSASKRSKGSGSSVGDDSAAASSQFSDEESDEGSEEYASTLDEEEDGAPYFFGLEVGEPVTIDFSAIRGVSTEARDEARFRSFESGIRLEKPDGYDDDDESVSSKSVATTATGAVSQPGPPSPSDSKKKAQEIDIRKGVGRTLGSDTTAAFKNFSSSVVSTKQQPSNVAQSKEKFKSYVPPPLVCETPVSHRGIQ